MLRFPRSKHESAIYGTAIHAALEDFLQDYHYKKTFHPAILIERFTQSLQQGGLEPSKEADLLARGSAQLEKLTPYLTGRTYGELHLEYRFTEGGGIYLPLDASDTPDSPQENNHTHIPTSIRLTGAIDRIEITPDGSLIITDYKTGGSLSSLTPKGSSYDRIKAWRYKLQLTFYALLFSKSARWNPWKHRKFSILFVESDTDTGEIHEITEYIQDGEIARLEALIRAVMQHVYTLNFPDIRSYAPTLEGILQFEEDLIN